ncbi:MAG TPA: efflux RND transporter periplasmic adaptor subunit [Dissulfurispiraceae bacterium]|nr:efflux RND transporter periplasmic adaptor subunit [Dissulfurispiraceae bacterium]
MHSMIVLLLVGLSLAGCGNKVSPGKAEVKHVEVPGVTTAEMKLSQVDDYIETSGTVKAGKIGVIASRIMGSVISIAVQEGQRVKSGQLLLTIDDRDIAQKVGAARNAVEAARQQKHLAEVTYERYAKLYEEKALSRQEFDQVETQKKVAQSEYERAKSMLGEAQEVHGYAHVKAPFSGVVTAKRIDSGSMAVPGMQLLTVEDTSSFLIETMADEKLSSSLRPGTQVDAKIDALGRDVKGKVSEVVPAIDPASRTFLVKIAISGEGLKTGLYAKVRIPSGKRDALTVPGSSIVEKGQLTGVYSVDAKGVISYRLVRTGKHYGNDVEVLSGLNAGDRIIVTGADKAVDGGIISGQTQAGK